MLFRGYSCLEDSFSRYFAGQTVSVCWRHSQTRNFYKYFTNFTKSNPSLPSSYGTRHGRAPKQLWLAVQSLSSAFNVIQWLYLFGGLVLEIFRREVFPMQNFSNLSSLLVNFSKTESKISKNNFGWLYRARAVLSMLFSGYSCSADPFSRYVAGQSVSVCWDLGQSLLAPFTNFTKSKSTKAEQYKKGVGRWRHSQEALYLENGSAKDLYPVNSVGSILLELYSQPMLFLDKISM